MPGKIILQFLLKVKQLVSAGRWAFVPRKKNLETLSNMGFTVKEVKDEILSLDLLDYQKGPEPDYSCSGDVWVFKRRIEGKELYIKLKIDIANDGYEALKCISFHD